MSELLGQGEPKPQDPELLTCQADMKNLCEEILVLKPEHIQITYWDVLVETDANALQQRMRDSRFGDLLLKDGDTLSYPTPNNYYPDLNLYVGQAAIKAVFLRAWKWEFDKYRINPEGPTKPPYDIIRYPGEKDWQHQLDICLHYSNDGSSATQKITMQTDSMSAGHLPSISRDVSAMAYAEQGYEGHNQEYRQCKDAEEASEFIAIARELFESH